MNVLSRTMLAAAAASMTVLPVAAEAGTRAGDSGTTYAISAPGKGRVAKGENFLFGLGFLLSFVVVGGVVVSVVVTAVAISNNNRTPGAI